MVNPLFYTLYAVFIVVQGRRFVNGKTGFPRGKIQKVHRIFFLPLSCKRGIIK
jgi:hypothetical protein